MPRARPPQTTNMYVQLYKTEEDESETEKKREKEKSNVYDLFPLFRLCFFFSFRSCLRRLLALSLVCVVRFVRFARCRFANILTFLRNVNILIVPYCETHIYSDVMAI